METTPILKKRVSTAPKTVLMLPDNYYPNRSTLKEESAAADAHLFKPYVHYEDIEPYVGKHNRSLAKKVTTYIDELADKLGRGTDSMYSGTGLRNHYGLPPVENRVMSFSVILGDAQDNIPALQEEFKAAREQYFVRDGDIFKPVAGSLFDSFKYPVEFVTNYDAPKKDHFRVRSVIERNDMLTQAMGAFSSQGRDLAEIIFYNQAAFDDLHNVYQL